MELLNQSQSKMATDVDIKCYRGYEALFEMMSHHYIELIKVRMQKKQNELKQKIEA
jgi:hypothetical protein